MTTLQITDKDGEPFFELEFNDKTTRFSPKEVVKMIFQKLLGKVVRIKFSYNITLTVIIIESCLVKSVAIHVNTQVTATIDKSLR